MKNYANVSDYTMRNFGTVDYNTDHTLKYNSIVKDLDYEACKNILLTFTTVDKLKEKYKEDEHLNGCFLNARNPLDVWNTIGYLMLTNPNRTITFKKFSLCNLTCIAKQCAKMIVMEV